MNIRERMRQWHSPEHKAELERRYREESRKFWIRFIKIQSPLWVILAIELIALWYVKTH